MSKKIYLEVKDHSVSGEIFQLLYNQEMDMLETSPQPSLDNLPKYYQSEDYISHTDTKRNLFEKAYHKVRSVALKRKLKLINSISNQDKTLLDVGCGTGDFLKLAQENNWNVKGIEPDDKARLIANRKTQNAVFKTEDLLKFDADSFNVITLWHVLEHLPKLEEHISLFEKLLKPNGTLIIAVPNYKSYDAQYYKSFWAAYDVPRHLWHFSKDSILKLMSRYDFKVEHVLPMKFDAYYVSLLSEKYKTGKMNIFKSFWIGWYSNLKAKQDTNYSSLIYVIKNKVE